MWPRLERSCCMRSYDVVWVPDVCEFEGGVKNTLYKAAKFPRIPAVSRGRAVAARQTSVIFCRAQSALA